MKFSVDKSELNNLLALVGKGVGSRATHPILNNILIVVAGNTLTLTGFNLSLGIRSSISADVEKPGSVTLPYASLSGIVSKLPEGELTFSGVVQMDSGGQVSPDYRVSITCPGHRFQVAGLPADEYPDLPTSEGDAQTVDGAVLSHGLGQVSSMVSTDETKQVLTGVCVRDGKFASTDGHRLSVFTPESPIDLDCIIPRAAVSAIRTVCQGEVVVFMGQGMLNIQAGVTTLSTRLLEGSYPNYAQLIPQQFARTLTLNVASLKDGLNLVSVLSGTSSIVRMDVINGEVFVCSSENESGSGECQVTAQTNFDDYHIAFNLKYLQDAINGASAKEVVLSANGPTSPVVITPVGRQDWLALVMPVQIRFREAV